MKRKFNLSMLCRRYSDGGATPPATEPVTTLPTTDPDKGTQGSNEKTPPATDPTKSEPITDKGFTQSDIDKAVADGIAKFKAEQENAKDYNKMTSEQKVAYLEAAAKDRTLQDFTVKHLEESNIPKEFASFLKGSDEEDTKKRTADFKSIYDTAVQAGVETRFKQSAYEPGKSSGSATSSSAIIETLEDAVSAAINIK